VTDKTLTILDESIPDESADSPEAATTAEPAAPAETGICEDSESGDPLQALRKANEDLAEQVKRTNAEFHNFRRRQEEEQKRVKVRIREDIIRSLLPILDHLERTMSAARGGGDKALESLLQGVELIDKDVRKIFESHGLTAIAAQGEAFDASLHQAVMMEETGEVPDQTILAELQKGYKLDDRVIRPSMVKVARNFSE
jgi:molecular chaperone GrpE